MTVEYVLTEQEREHRRYLRSEVAWHENQLRQASESLSAYERQLLTIARLKAGERVPVIAMKSQKQFEIGLVKAQLGVRFVQVFEHGKRKRGEAMMFGSDACNAWISSLIAT